MLNRFRSSRPLQKAARLGFATLLAASFVATASVSFASIYDNGTDVGNDCYDKNPHSPSGIQDCITDECKLGGRTAQQQSDCEDKAKKQVATRLDTRPIEVSPVAE